MSFSESFTELICSKSLTHLGIKLMSRSLAAFSSTYFYAHFGLLHKKALDGNANMRINSENLSMIHFLSDKKKCA